MDADPHVDEVHHTAAAAYAIDEIPHCTPTHKAQRDEAYVIPGLRVAHHGTQNNQRHDRQHQEDPARIRSDIDSKGRAGIVHQLESQPIADDLDWAWRKMPYGKQLSEDVKRDDRATNYPEQSLVTAAVFHLPLLPCT